MCSSERILVSYFTTETLEKIHHPTSGRGVGRGGTLQREPGDLAMPRATPFWHRDANESRVKDTQHIVKREKGSSIITVAEVK